MWFATVLIFFLISKLVLQVDPSILKPNYSNGSSFSLSLASSVALFIVSVAIGAIGMFAFQFFQKHQAEDEYKNATARDYQQMSDCT